MGRKDGRTEGRTEGKKRGSNEQTMGGMKEREQEERNT